MAAPQRVRCGIEADRKPSVAADKLRRPPDSVTATKAQRSLDLNLNLHGRLRGSDSRDIGGEVIDVREQGARPNSRVLVPVREKVPVRENLRSDVIARPSASWTESFTPLSVDRPFRILVTDTMPASARTPGVAASAVAALLSRMGVATRRSTPAGPEELLSEVKAAAPHFVLLVLHKGAQHHCGGNAADAWDRPAVLTRAYQQAGVPVIALSIGGSAAALAACVGYGALVVFDIEQLPDELAHIAGCRRGRDSADMRGRDLDGQSEPGHRRLPPTFEKLTHLTPTERRVLYHLTEGLPAGDIAARMIVSLSTVRAHIRSILRKLDVGSQLSAVAIANGSECSGHSHATIS
jgi:DNA-binding NarL/FixJ family response regulator